MRELRWAPVVTDPLYRILSRSRSSGGGACPLSTPTAVRRLPGLLSSSASRENW